MSERISATAWPPPLQLADCAGDVPARADAVVVGAGLTGLSCAYHLLRQRPMASVVVLDAAAIGYGASGRTTGMVTPGIGQDYAALVKRLGARRAAAVYQETRAAVHYVGELVAAEAIDCEHERVALLMVASGKAGAARLARQAVALEATGQPCQRLDPFELAERVRLRIGPANTRADALAALRLPDAATLNPVKLLHGLARAIQQRGGKLVGHARVLSMNAGATPSLRLASGQTLAAATVVLATASESTSLANLTGRIIPIRLKIAATEPLAPECLLALGWKGRECIIDSRRLFNYFRLTRDRRIVFGGGAPAYGSASRAASFDDLLQEMRRTFPEGESLQIAKTWCGTIDYTLDGLPMIGPVRPDGDVFYVGGFCGHGIALGIRSGKWVADLIARKSSRRAFPGFRSKAPLIPGEWLRRSCFAAASGWMRLRGT